jgi:mono/diheme cytochrome c family protein
VNAIQKRSAKAIGRLTGMSALAFGGGAVLLGMAGTASTTQAQAPDRAYAVHCQSCHKADGSGTPGMFPRLSGRLDQVARTPEGRKWLAAVVLHGQSGAITVDGKPIRAAMPGYKRLSDGDLAASLNASVKGAKPFTAAEIAAVRGQGDMPAAKVGEMRKAIAGQLK